MHSAKHFLMGLVLVGASVSAHCLAAEVTKEPFGSTAQGKPVELYRLKGDGGVTVEIISRGATIRSVLAPDAAGKVVDVVNGFDTVAGYESEDNQYFGCTVGRVCNRIGGAKFELDGRTYSLAANDGKNTLHGGGPRSLDKVLWEGEIDSSDPKQAAVTFSYFSPDGEEGFPGNMHISVRFALTPSNSLVIRYSATTDLLTPVNLTNHAYFNLAGAGSGTVLDHELMIDADAYTPTDEGLIPTGEIKPVDGTPLDFRKMTRIGDRIESLTATPAIGYDHNFVLNNTSDDIREVAILRDPASGRTVKVLTDQPGLQFYSGNFLKGQKGKDGKTYVHRGAVCMEAQHFPDSVHHENFPSILLSPGEEYRQTTIYQFGTK
ncbi:MAG: aldose epimerase family protein [Planctomycetaceae bacterium]